MTEGPVCFLLGGGKGREHRIGKVKAPEETYKKKIIIIKNRNVYQMNSSLSVLSHLKKTFTFLSKTLREMSCGGG